MLKIELGILAVALIGAGVFAANADNPMDIADRAGAEQFSAADFGVFDREFDHYGDNCAVGLKAHKICFGNSPLEAQLRIGEPLPPVAPIVGAEFRIIVETDLKAPHLQTVRYGQTLALVDPATRVVRDVLSLSATDYASARNVAGETSV